MRHRAPTVVALALISVALAGCAARRTILDGSSTSGPGAGSGITVWFLKSAGAEVGLVPVNRPLRGQNHIEQAVQDLLQGPSSDEAKEGLATEVPVGTLLLEVTGGGDNVEINLSRRFISGGGTSSFELRLSQLRRTVASAAGGKKVYLNIEGKRLHETIGEGIEVHQPINDAPVL